MTRSARSLFFFGIYSICAGLVFIIIPETLFSMSQLPATPPGWARVIGLLILVIGTYDMFSAKAGLMPYIKVSVYVRLGFAAGAALLVVLGQMPMPFLLFGAVDAVGAVWTAIALKQETV